MPLLWNRVPSESNYCFPMLWAFSLTMTFKENSTKPIDPSSFLWALERNFSSMTVAPFDFNSQQDVAEILQVVLDELKGGSLAASSLISNTQYLWNITAILKNHSILLHLPMPLCFRGKPQYTAHTSINWYTNFSRLIYKPWDFIITE